MWCLVRRPDAVVEEVVVAPKAVGQKCLREVCERLGIIETDYFGLRYTGKKGEQLWLNLRNPIRDQLPNFPPYRLELQVKFFVNPQQILQRETRNQFYLQLKSDLVGGKFKLDRRQVIILSALIAQIEFGDHAEGQNRYPSYVPEWTVDLDHVIATQHSRLRDMDEDSAKINFLLEMHQLEKYGMETYSAWSCDQDKEPVEIGIKEDAVKIFDKNGKIVLASYRFNNIRQAAFQGRHFFLLITGETSSPNGKARKKICFQMQSKTSASAIYRCFTEVYTFYRRNTVGDWVKQSGNHGNVLESIISYFRPRSSSTNKQYNFDVIRTRTEAIDRIKQKLEVARNEEMLRTRMRSGSDGESNAPSNGRYRKRRTSDSIKAGFHEPTRRQLCRMRLRQSSTDISPTVDDSGADIFSHRGRSLSEGNLLRAVENESVPDTVVEGRPVRKCSSEGNLLDSDFDYTPAVDTRRRANSLEIRKELHNLEESLNCKICMDKKMNTAFCPCGHMVCCRKCASQCTECPVCRSEIKWLQTIYMQ
ncbi:E3 ubiquitin-protein ligase MYLIP-like [Glandiceps talaboti]